MHLSSILVAGRPRGSAAHQTASAECGPNFSGSPSQQTLFSWGEGRELHSWKADAYYFCLFLWLSCHPVLYFFDFHVIPISVQENSPPHCLLMHQIQTRPQPENWARTGLMLLWPIIWFKFQAYLKGWTWEECLSIQNACFIYILF